MLKDKRSELWVVLEDIQNFEEFSVVAGWSCQMMQDFCLLLWGENATARNPLLTHFGFLHIVAIFVAVFLLIVVIVSLCVLLRSRSRMELKSPIAHRHDWSIYHRLCRQHRCRFNRSFRVEKTAHFRLACRWEHRLFLLFFILWWCRHRAWTIFSKLRLQFETTSPCASDWCLLGAWLAPSYVWQTHLFLSFFLL